MEFDPQKIYWQAHRGGGRCEAPDNTLYAMQYGWEMGGIPEADVRVTADQVVICLHDNTLRRTTDAPDEIADLPAKELNFEEIRKYDAGKKFRADLEGQHVPALREVFEVMAQDQQKMLYLDIKNYDREIFPQLFEGFRKLVEEFNIASRLIVAGRDYELNSFIKEEIPEIKTMQWIGKSAPERMRTFRELAENDFKNLDLVQLHLYRQEQPPPSLWSYDLPLHEIMYAVERLGSRLEVFPFGDFTTEEIGILLDLGIRQFATDEPKRFKAVLEEILSGK